MMDQQDSLEDLQHQLKAVKLSIKGRILKESLTNRDRHILKQQMSHRDALEGRIEEMLRGRELKRRVQ